MKARIAGIQPESVTDGPGVRTVLFFQGCRQHCPGCHNPQTWALDGGEEVELDELWLRLKDNPLISGITLSGGEPFLQASSALQIARRYQALGKDVWAYTGFVWEDLLAIHDPDQMALLKNCDVLVDGRFEKDKKQMSLLFRGSSNQRIIDVTQSLRHSQVVLYDECSAFVAV
jgi:anaerobic ribonucleoside-triphosphate reductase activating protein